MKRNVWCFLCALVMTGLWATSVWGQTITGTIVGQVNDASGGVVPSARITVTNTETGIPARGRSTSSGTYSIPNLQPGIYSVTVTKTGFETYQVSGIRLLSSQTVRVDVRLKVGSLQQVVSVTGAAPLVHTDTQSIADSIPTRIIDDLPKSSQSIDTLIRLVPGVAYTGADAQIGGSAYWGGNDWSLNGVSMQDASNGRGEGAYGIGMITEPSTNALQEFKVATGALNAEYRNTTSVTMVLKQGTNNFHGEGYGYFENKDLNANLFLNNAHGLPRPDYDRDQFGGLIGGPIKKDKLFFFVDYFHFRQASPTLVSLTFPSAAVRRGDFSALCTTFSANGICANGTQLYNPQTGQPFIGNQINPATFSPIAKALVAYMPLPNLPANAAGLPGGAPNYQASVPNLYPKTNLDSRLDWQISPKDSLNGFFDWSNSPLWDEASGTTPPNYGNYTDFRDEDWGVNATETHSFGSAAINEFRLTWHDYIQARQGQNFNLKPWTLVPSLPVQNTGGLPTVTMTGYTGLSDWGAGIPFPTYDIEISDNFTKIHGRHTFKAGFGETGYKFSVPGGDGHLTIQLGSYNGGFCATGAWTGGKGWLSSPSQGNSFADFMLGDLNSTNYATVVNSTVLLSRLWEGYAQDSWQATPKLTINYGLRYMYQSPWEERNHYFSSIDLSNSKLVLMENSSTPTAPPTSYPSLLSAYPFETSQQAGWPTSYYITDKTNWGPRFGFAWRPFGGSKTAIRGGYGIFYNFIGSELGTLEMTFNPPFRVGPTFATNLPAKAPVGGYLPDLTFANPFPTSGSGAPAANPLIYFTPRNLQNPREEQWTLTFEQQFGQNWMARASYVGAQTQHLYWYAFNINQPAVQQPNVILQDQRPFQPWGNINDDGGPGGLQNFDQLQLELIKRFSNSLSFQAEYNWTRSLDDVPVAGGLNNPWCYRCDYGPSDYLSPQTLAFNYVYGLPIGNGRRWLNKKGVADAVLGGWEVAGITTYVAGAPTSTTSQVTFNVPSSVVGWWGGTARPGCRRAALCWPAKLA